jgi:hypothetical protein
MLRCSCCNIEAVLNAYDLCEECEVAEEYDYNNEDSDYSFID